VIYLKLTVVIVTLFSLAACNKTGSNDSKYPRNFPQECIVAYDQHDELIQRLRATGRFTEESLNENDRNFQNLLINFKNPSKSRTPPMEEYVIGCNRLNEVTQRRLNRFESIKNINSLSDDELQEIMGIYTKSTSR